MSRRRPSGDDEGGYSWMDTYGDMVTLLLTFFVLLFAFSTVNEEKWSQLVYSITGFPPLKRITAVDMLTMPDFSEYVPQGLTDMVQLNLGSGKKEDEQGAENNNLWELSPEELNKLNIPISQQQLEIMKSPEYQRNEALFSQLYERLVLYIQTNGLEDMLFASRDMESIYLRVAAGIFFDSGKADLLPEAIPVLDKIEDIVYTARDSISLIVVEGHTDNVPIHTARFRDNWELSSMRAINVARFIMNKGRLEPELFSFSGYGEYKPIATNDTDEGRQQNRRVEFVLRKRVITTEDLTPAQETALIEEEVPQENLQERLQQPDEASE